MQIMILYCLKSMILPHIFFDIESVPHAINFDLLRNVAKLIDRIMAST